MHKVVLDGEWKLYYFPQGEQNIENPDQLVNLRPISASVPGNVELDLIKAGELPEDLFFGDNIHKLKPYEQYEWWYKKEFALTDRDEDTEKRAELVFHGVDCLAEYWLNGQYIGDSDNMFIEHRFNVTDLLKYDEVNTLSIRIRSVFLEAMGKEYPPAVTALQSNWEQLWIRKAPHSYGWDIMPRALSAGLWRSVELVWHDEYEINDVYYFTEKAWEGYAKIGIHFSLQVDADMFDDLRLDVQGHCGDSAFSKNERVVFRAGKIEIDIPYPRLWWPFGYGEANLYEIEMNLVYKGNILTSRTDIIGIRSVEFIHSDNRASGTKEGGEFLFKVNGVPILFKGSNWVPADVFHSRDAGKYSKFLELFRSSKCNIIRSWGGNVYEDHPFYSYCDKYGIMVWQDFSMACARYPQTPEFKEIMYKEAVAVIKKLRNHPAILIWSGDNECDSSFNGQGLDPANNKITREVLPWAVSQYDPYRPFLGSSPYLSPFVVSKRDESIAPEQHLWGPRDYYKSRFYAQNTAHFVSEMGYQGCPNLSSIKKFVDVEHLWPWENNSQWIIHCTDSLGKGGAYEYRIKLIADQIKEFFGFYPDNIEDFVLASQISQAEAKKYFIEMTRLKKWDMTGIIWWNMIDGWPQFSDAVVDYYMGKKLAYYYIRRVQEPFCIMVDEPESWHVRVVAGNDSQVCRKGSYRIWDADTEEILLQGEFSVNANENKELGQIRISHSDKRVLLIRWTIDGVTFANHYLLGYPAFSLAIYKGWLKKIAFVNNDFSAEDIGK